MNECNIGWHKIKDLNGVDFIYFFDGIGLEADVTLLTSMWDRIYRG